MSSGSRESRFPHSDSKSIGVDINSVLPRFEFGLPASKIEPSKYNGFRVLAGQAKMTKIIILDYNRSKLWHNWITGL
jgi:hypothetical protein